MLFSESLARHAVPDAPLVATLYVNSGREGERVRGQGGGRGGGVFILGISAFFAAICSIWISASRSYSERRIIPQCFFAGVNIYSPPRRLQFESPPSIANLGNDEPSESNLRHCPLSTLQSTPAPFSSALRRRPRSGQARSPTTPIRRGFGGGSTT